MKRSTTAAMTILFGAMVLPGIALAVPQTKAQQKCINALNKSMAKVANAQNKANAKCVKARAKDGTTDVFMCADGDAKVAAAQAKTLQQESKACGVQAPDFGYTSGGSVNNRAAYEASDFPGDVFGTNAGVAACDADKAACKCQGKVFKAANKIYKTHLKTYNKCKKKGLSAKNAPFEDAEDLAQCVADDPNGKIAKAESKLTGAISTKCNGVASPFTDGECAALTGPALSMCLQERVRCHACLTESLSDDLDVNCDLVDDGDDKNGSCFDEF